MPPQTLRQSCEDDDDDDDDNDDDDERKRLTGRAPDAFKVKELIAGLDGAQPPLELPVGVEDANQAEQDHDRADRFRFGARRQDERRRARLHFFF